MIGFDAISGVRLFHQADARVVEQVLAQGAQIKHYQAGQVIVEQAEPCLHIGFVIKGEVLMQHQYPCGRMVTFEQLRQGDTMGAALLYLQRPYPATAYAQTSVSLLFIPRDVMTQLLHRDAQVMQNFITMLSARTLALNHAVRLLSQKGVLQKLAVLLLDLSQQQGTMQVTLPHGREKLAQLMAIPRPSVSRGLSQLRKRGMISYKGNCVHIVNCAALENLI